MEDLKLSTLAIKKLKKDFKIDVMKGANINLDDEDVIAQITTCCAQHWPKPPSFKEVQKNFDFFEMAEAVGNLFKAAPGKKPATKKVARKRTR